MSTLVTSRCSASLNGRALIGPALLDSVRPDDPIVARIVLDGAEVIGAMGLALAFERDLEALRALNEHVVATQPGSWYPLLPLIRQEAMPEDAWWLRVWDPAQIGDGAEAATVACYGERLVRAARVSLRKRLESLDVFHGSSHRPYPHERLRLSAGAADLADNLSDCVVSFGVAGWTRADHRRRRLVRILADLCRTLAAHIWGRFDLAYGGEVAFVSRGLVDAGMVARYGYEGSVRRVDWTGGVLGDVIDAELIWSPAQAIARRTIQRAHAGFAELAA